MNNNESNYIDQQTKIIGNTKIGKNCKISGSVLEDAIIGDNVTITNSTISKSSIGSNTSVGPYAHIRGNSKISENVRVGNFVEIKNSIIAKGTKIAHLAYVGDAEVGENVNIGCGVVFANYDGKNKHRTIVGNRVFIGSNSNLVAPLFIEDDSFIAAGTTVTNNICQGEFCIGRVRNEIKKGILNADINADTIQIRNINAEKFSSNLSLNENMKLDIKNYQFNLAEGVVNGNMKYDFLINDFKLFFCLQKS